MNPVSKLGKPKMVTTHDDDDDDNDRDDYDDVDDYEDNENEKDATSMKRSYLVTK